MGAVGIVTTSVWGPTTIVASDTQKTDAVECMGRSMILWKLEAANENPLDGIIVQVADNQNADDGDWEDASTEYDVVTAFAEGKRLDHGTRPVWVSPKSPFVGHGYMRLSMLAGAANVSNLQVTASQFNNDLIAAVI
jgi:hypothetical protein